MNTQERNNIVRYCKTLHNIIRKHEDDVSEQIKQIKRLYDTLTNREKLIIIHFLVTVMYKMIENVNDSKKDMSDVLDTIFDNMLSVEGNE